MDIEELKQHIVMCQSGNSVQKRRYIKSEQFI